MFKFLGRFVMRHSLSVLAVVSFVLYKADKKRREKSYLNPRSYALKKFAEKNGFGFALYDFSIYKKDFANLPFFTRYTRRLFTNILSKEGVTAFDFIHPLSVKNDVSAQTVAVVEMRDSFDFSLGIYPSGFLRKYVLSHKDMEMFENKTFVKKFHLTRENIDDFKLKKIINLDVEEFFAQNPGWTVVIYGKYVVILKEHKLIKPVSMGIFIDKAFYIAGMLDLV